MSVEENISRARIEASIADQITFASHQNDVAVIADLNIYNDTQDSLDNLELVLECAPALLAAKRWKIDRLLPQSEIRIKDRKVSLNGALLSELNERLRSEVQLTLYQGEKVLASFKQELIGLARNEWGGASHMPELLAAFSMPNDSAVTTILKEAGEVLRRAGEQPALDGYQSKSRMRVWQIASAIWSAISARRLVYAEPPASFELNGQKIRTPSEILEGGLATCLDTTLLFAAALEQAGLYPVIAMTKGHALCGVWLQPQQLPALTSEDCSDIRKYIDLKELALFETTMVVSEPPSSFSKAIAEGTRRVSEELELDFIYALDIKQSRRRQITPIGQAVKVSAFINPENTNELVLGLEAAPVLPSFDLGLEEGPKPDSPETRLDHWKRKLLDLTKRNRLLNLRPSKTAIRLYCPSPAILEDKLAENKKISVIPSVKLAGQKGERDNSLFQARTGDDFAASFAKEALERDEIVADMSQTDLDAGLVQLYRKARTDLEEGGANTLYLALGMLKWKQSPQETQTYRAPLILVPVKLERSSAASKVRIVQHEDEPVFNMTLLEMLRQDFELRIPSLEGELPKDESGVDVPLIWETVRKAVRDMPGFEMVEDVVLSTFSFAKYLMWKDLADRTDVLKQNQFVRHLIERPRDSYEHSAQFMQPEQIDEKIKPSELFMPLSTDSSQVVAIHASTQAGDFVLEGPPGTGKSQTISNIIAHNLAMGRKVLFVSEKMTALEVVYKRLKDRGLGDFCLELHSSKANKKEVLDQLGASWRNRKLKTRQQWHEQANKLEAVRDKLNSFVKALHTPGPSGISPRMAIGRSVYKQDEHRLRLDWTGDLQQDRAGSPQERERLELVSKKLGQSYAGLSKEDAEAFSEISQSDWSNAWQARLIEISRQLITAIDRLTEAERSFSQKTNLPGGAGLLTRIRALSKFAENISICATKSYEFALGSNSSVFQSIEEALSLLNAYKDERRRLSCKYSDEKILSAPIDVWQKQWAEAAESVWPIEPVKQILMTRKIRKDLSLSESPSLHEDLPILARMKNYRQKLDLIGKDLHESTLWRGLDTECEKLPAHTEAGRKLRECVVRLAQTPDELSELMNKVKKMCVDGREMIQPGSSISQAASELVEAATNFDSILLNYSKETDFASESNDELETRKVRLQKLIELQPHINSWCRWQAAKKEANASGMSCLVKAIEERMVEPSDAQESFQTAYCLWLADRLIDQRPELRTFAAVSHEDLIKEFQKLDEELSNLSVDYIRAKLSGDIPDFEGHTRPAGYGVLSRELQKRMRHKPVRQLVREIGDVLTTLTPCLLMSPLSVSQFLPPDNQLFDLVVFDEASQITVWDAIGAIARGRNVIVVGDPKQMPPTSFFDRAASDEDDQDENSTEDLESILDEGLAAGVKLHRLTGHYRSRHESLIAFSNHRYYDGELVTFPCAETRESAVSLVNVKGVYQRGKGRTNPIEAKAVVSEILTRLKDPILSKQTIGVVTFNSEQKRLIEDLLDQERRRYPELEVFFEAASSDDQVVVKNLETVQGHERDVILLSIGYGPDTEKAQTMPMNFGPLNRKGGERRLNVAITRAKSEMKIFASFDPAMIDLTRTSAQAVRDLKHYLEFAQRGPVALAEAVKFIGEENRYDSDFEKSVAEKLRARGWRIHTQVGVSKFRIDLGVIHPDFPGKYLAGIECDGAAYHASPSARDRDRVRHVILENLGWKLVRVWSTDYFLDSERALNKIEEQLKFLLEADREAVIKASRDAEKPTPEVKIPSPDRAKQILEVDLLPSAIEQIDSPVIVSSLVDNQVTLQTAANQENLSPEHFYETEYLNVLKAYACGLVDKLGPINFSHLCEKIARAHGFQRTGSQIKSQIWSAMSKDRHSSKTLDGETLFWPKTIPVTDIFGYRGLVVEGHERSWADVPYPEKLSLAILVAKEGPHNDDAAFMASKIGLGRLSKTTREELEGLLALVNQAKAS